MGHICVSGLFTTAMASNVESSRLMWHMSQTSRSIHRLHVEQCAAVIKVEFIRLAIVQCVAEGHELRWSANVELQTLEDGQHIVDFKVQRPLHTLGIEQASASLFLNDDLQNKLLNTPGHAGAVDHMPCQQQFRNARVPTQCGTTLSTEL